MVSCRFGGTAGFELTLEDAGDLVVVRSNRRGARHDQSPLRRQSRAARAQLAPLFGVSAAGVGVYKAPPGGSEELSKVINGDPEVQFAGRGLKDQFGAPVLYTENMFVKFEEGASKRHCADVLKRLKLTVKRPVGTAPTAYFVGAPAGVGRRVFDVAGELLEREDVELCHPEVVRELRFKKAFPQQWHLHRATVGGKRIDAHANVAPAWRMSKGRGTVIAVIDDGFDIDHEEFASDHKIVAPQAFVHPRTENPRPGDGQNHGTGCGGVACGDGNHGASGVAPEARLMPLRMVSGLGSQDEADSFVWAADQGADVISCSWGPPDGAWWDPNDPTHEQVVPLPDNTRLAIDYATSKGRGGKGCVITWAAGNGNESVDNDGYAKYGKVIAVAASNDMSKRSAYSDFGDAVWCCFPSNNGEPSLTPGIWTTDRSGPDGYNSGHPSMGDKEGDYTQSFGGTSSACPGVAGVAALILARNPNLRWDEVKDVLRQSADRIDDKRGEYDKQGHSKKYGYGRVNAAEAVKLARKPRGG